MEYAEKNHFESSNVKPRNLTNNPELPMPPVDQNAFQAKIMSPPAPPASTTIDETNSPFTSATPSSADLVQATAAAAAKIESIKKWTVNTYKTTKHSIIEQLGKVSKTVDKDLEDRIESLRDLQRRYIEVLTNATIYLSHFNATSQAQRALADAIYQLSIKEDSLKNELTLHSESHLAIAQNSEVLNRSLHSLCASLTTLTDKTIQDTLLTIEQHDQSRLEFDMYRTELEALRSGSTANPNNNNVGVSASVLNELEEKCNLQKLKYEQLKEDVRVKLTLLEENRCKVMRRQINLVQKAFSAYLEGSTSTLQKVCSQISQSLDEAELNALANGVEQNKKDEDPMGDDFNRHHIHHNSHPHANSTVPSFLEQ